MDTRKFKKASFIDKAIKKARSASVRHEWENISLSKQERAGMSPEELAELRKAKLAEQKRKRIEMRKVEDISNMTILMEKSLKRLK
jgi:hypothetical protein